MSIIDSRLSFLNECINVLGSGRTACAFAFTSHCCVIDFETEFCMHWYVLIFEVVIRVRCGVFRCTALSQSHPRLLSKHNDDDDWPALMFVEWMKHYRRPCTNRLYVFIATCLPSFPVKICYTDNDRSIFTSYNGLQELLKVKRVKECVSVMRTHIVYPGLSYAEWWREIFECECGFFFQ